MASLASLQAPMSGKSLQFVVIPCRIRSSPFVTRWNSDLYSTSMIPGGAGGRASFQIIVRSSRGSCGNSVNEVEIEVGVLVGPANSGGDGDT